MSDLRLIDIAPLFEGAGPERRAFPELGETVGLGQA